MECPDTTGGAHGSALIGRDREIRRLLELLDAVSPGRVCVLVIEGPPGSGRTRLLEEFAAIGRRRGATVALEAQWSSAAGVRQVLHRRPGGTLLLVCDHPQRIDPGVWSLLDVLAESTPVLVAMTGQAGTEQHVAREVHRIRLTALLPGEVGRLATALLGGRPGAELLDLSRVAAGRPAAVRDLITGLREEGLVRVVAGRATLTGVRLPRRTRSRLANQFAALSPQARHLLQAATLLRSPFPLVQLTRLLQVSPMMVLPAIDEVLESGLLTGDNEMLMFGHELVRAVVESSIPRPVAAAMRAEHARPGPRPAKPGAKVPCPPRIRRVPLPGAAPARRAVDWGLLTPREQEIADLTGQALTNRQIASRVALSPHTVNYHLRQIFQKLAITSRVELAALLRQREVPAAAELPASGPSSS